MEKDLLFLLFLHLPLHLSCYFIFFEFSLIGIFLNILYVPFFSSFLVPFIFVCFLFSKVPILATFLNGLLDFSVAVMEQTTKVFQIFDGTMFTAGKPSEVFTLLLVLVTLLIFLYWEKRYFKRTFCLTILFFSVCQTQ
ncbi:hypothetical protein MAQA_11631 [Listeria aquatica FSL S10-1188]|uniref:ComEC/Rec2-related protein domain-containing protein n=1 Tax=Listeria aquatica FSL S10-1188 TaxID=1265818 RepID=W7BCL6_9LIST|nr:hypothetical protein MAQA_11631 [Listeria aquatica FSL S10-1188]